MKTVQFREAICEAMSEEMRACTFSKTNTDLIILTIFPEASLTSTFFPASGGS